MSKISQQRRSMHSIYHETVTISSYLQYTFQYITFIISNIFNLFLNGTCNKIEKSSKIQIVFNIQDFLLY